MKNLAGDKKCDETIKEELYLAGILINIIKKGTTEVPYRYIGKLGNWTFKRNWTYWVAKVENDEHGLPLDLALELHNKQHPTERKNLGSVIRSGGDAGAPSPDEYAAQPIYDDELDEKLMAIGYEKKYSKIMQKDFISITYGEMSKICNEGKLDVERFVNTYHIDSQIGLTAFASFIKAQTENKI